MHIDNLKKEKDKVFYVLAYAYSEGVGVASRNLSRAVFFLRRSAKLGNPDAQYMLGHFYLNKIGTCRHEFKKAFRLFAFAHKAGLVAATCELAYCFSNGIGCAQDKKKALKLYRQAALAGDGLSSFNAGLFYEFGLGCRKDKRKAMAYYRRAACAGDKDAKKILCELTGSANIRRLHLTGKKVRR